MSDRLIINDRIYRLHDVIIVKEKPLIKYVNDTVGIISMGIDLYVRELNYQFHHMEFTLASLEVSLPKEDVEIVKQNILPMIYQSNTYPVCGIEDDIFLLRGQYYARIYNAVNDQSFLENILNGKYDAFFTNRV